MFGDVHVRYELFGDFGLKMLLFDKAAFTSCTIEILK